MKLPLFILQIGNSLSVSGRYKGYEGSLEVDINTFKQSMKAGSRLSTKKMILTTGGEDMPEPIKVKLMPIYKAIDMDFFKDLKYPGLSDCDFPRVIDQKSDSVKKILKKYPNLKGVHEPEGMLPGNGYNSATVSLVQLEVVDWLNENGPKQAILKGSIF